MVRATNLEELREAWQNFLNRLEKVWVKAERECQPVREKFEPWQGKYKRLRHADPLLAYLHHARNADHHTIQPMVLMAKGIRFKLPPRGTAEIMFDPRTKAITVKGDAFAHTIDAASYALMPVSDRGLRYDPPGTHLGAPLHGIDPLTVARAGLDFYTRFVEEIEKKFG